MWGVGNGEWGMWEREPWHLVLSFPSPLSPLPSLKPRKIMKRTLIPFFALCFISMTSSFANAQEIKITENKEKKQIDVTVGGQPFTSYVFWDDQKKPILYPLRTSKGTVVTRGFPLAKVDGERTDHPNHISMWFNYGNI